MGSQAEGIGKVKVMKKKVTGKPPKAEPAIDAQIHDLRVQASKVKLPGVYWKVSSEIDPMEQSIKNARSTGSSNVSKLVGAAKEKLNELCEKIGNLT